MAESDNTEIVPTEHKLVLSGATSFPKIIWVIPVAAVVITLLVVVRTMYGPLWRSTGSTTVMVTPAPPIQLRDQTSEIVRTSRYLGRRRLVVVFYDGQLGPENSQQLLEIREALPKIQAAGAEVIAVSVATPYRNRQGSDAVGPFPFPLLSDVDYAVQKEWGVVGGDVEKLEQAVFLVGRQGMIRWANKAREQHVSADDILKELGKIP